MAKLRLSGAAIRDLERIRAEGIAEHGAAASDRYLLGFDLLFQLLREQPKAGQERPEFKKNVRSLPYRPYRILYRVERDVVIIDRVVHQARDVGRALRGEQ